MQKHCRFERKVAKELAYQISNLDHLMYSPFSKVYTLDPTFSTKYIHFVVKAVLKEYFT
jgi:hypothetical protein